MTGLKLSCEDKEGHKGLPDTVFRLYSLSLFFLVSLLPLTLSYAGHGSFSDKAPLYSTRSSSIDDYPFIKHYDWFKDQQAKVNFKQAIQFISQAENYGLAAEDYHLDQLKTLAFSNQQNKKQKLNQLTTESLASLIHDLKNGRYNAKVVDPAWHIEQSQFDAYHFLQHAIQADELAGQLQNLVPQEPIEQTLIEGLKRYQAYAEQDNWPTIPSTRLLKKGDTHPNLIPIQQRLAAEDKFFAVTHTIPVPYFDDLVEQAVRRFQARYGLKIDGIIGAETIRTMNIPAKTWLHYIKVNLERRRWLPEQLPDRYIMLNTANYTLAAYENHAETFSMKVIVGRASRQTPSFVSQLDRFVFNPYWNVPKRLARLDLLPKQQQNPNYFTEHMVKVFSEQNGQKVELNPNAINWHQYSQAENLPYTLWQEPGIKNALGRIKFMFPNQWAIYLHDTHQRTLFDEQQRAFSSGCIRVEQPIKLAEFAFANPEQKHIITEQIDSNENKGLRLEQPLTIYAVYFTVFNQGNTLRFMPDIYQRDAQMIKTLY